MAADFIPVNRTKQLGNSLVQAADLTRQLRNSIDALADAANHQNTGGDFTQMEEQFGLEPGAGANTATLIGLIDTIFNKSSDVTGAARLAQLDEFCARLGGQ
jgi:hypothetical protein